MQAALPTCHSANWPGGLSISPRLERSRLLCPPATVLTGMVARGPLADMTVPGIYPRCSLGLDTSRRKSAKMRSTARSHMMTCPPNLPPAMSSGPDAACDSDQIGLLCPPATVPTDLVASTLFRKRVVPGTYPQPDSIAPHPSEQKPGAWRALAAGKPNEETSRGPNQSVQQRPGLTKIANTQ